MSAYSPHARKYCTLQEALDRIEELEIELGMPAQKQAPFGLTRREFEIVSIIGKTGYATKDRLMTLIYGGTSDANENTLKMLVKKARDKLTPHGLSIVTVWGSGHSMDAESLAKWRAATIPEGQP